MPQTKRSFWKKIIIGKWILLVGVAAYMFGRSDLSIKEIPNAMHVYMQGHGALGPLIFILLYTLRPLIFFPATLMTMAAGLAWGPLWGTIFTIIGENFSAWLAFYFGRWLGKDVLEESGIKFLHGVNRHLNEHGFITILILRLAFMPFDVVNYACGLTKMRFTDYAAGTFIGIIPGIISFVFFGAAWFDRRNLIISGTIFLLGLGLAYLMKHTKAGEKIMKSIKF